ncbi:hypothetical protein Emed_004283 [Eimeria media]
MTGAPFSSFLGQDLHAHAIDATLQDQDREFARPSSTHVGCRFHVASALAALLAVTALVSLILQCHVWIARDAKTAGLERRGLASSDEEDDSKTSADVLLQICKGPPEGEAHAAADHGAHPQATPVKNPDASAQQSEHGGTFGETSAPKSRGKTRATLELLWSLPDVPVEWSDNESSEDTISLPSPPSRVEDESDADEEPPKKKRREEPIEGEKRGAKSETSLLGRLEDDLSVELPPSLLDNYLKDTLEAAQEGSLADWLVDPNKEFPQSPEPPKEDEGPPVAESPLEETYPSLETLMQMVEEAAAIITEQLQSDEAAGASAKSLGESSTQQHADGVASSSLEAGPALEEEPSTSAASASQASQLPNVNFVDAFGGRPVASLGVLLEAVRSIMAKPQLSDPDISELQRLGVSLMAYAGLNMRKAVRKGQPSQVLQPVAQRLLLGHYLLAVCDLVGPSMQRHLWWNLYMARVLEHPATWEPMPEDRARQVGRGRPALVQLIFEAMAILRRGDRVPAQLIVPIMQQLFCTSFTIKCFSSPEWAGWRQADDEFSGGSSSSGTSDEDQ